MHLGELLKQLTPLPHRAQIIGLHGSAAAYALAQLWARDAAHPWCCIAATPEAAQRLRTDLAFYVSAAHADRIFPFPACDVPPYQKLATSPDVTAQRLRTLHILSPVAGRPLAELTAPGAAEPLIRQSPACIVTPIAACFGATLPPDLLRAYSRTVQYADTLERDGFSQWLVEAGYVAAPLVEDIGTFAVRGAILDCWPPTSPTPVRIELEGDAVASIRCFDPATQRSQTAMDNQPHSGGEGGTRQALPGGGASSGFAAARSKTEGFAESTTRAPVMDAIAIGPAEELLFTPETREAAAMAFRQRADDAGLPATARRQITEAIAHGYRPPMTATFLPLFYAAPATLADYLPADMTIVLLDPAAIMAEAETVLHGLRAAHATAEPVAQLIRPEEWYRPGTEFFGAIADRKQLWIGSPPPQPSPTRGEGEIAASLSPQSPTRGEGEIAASLSPQSPTRGEGEVAVPPSPPVGEGRGEGKIVTHTESLALLRATLPKAATDQDPLTPLAEYLRQAQAEKYRATIVCHTGLAAERTIDLFRWHGLNIAKDVTRDTWDVGRNINSSHMSHVTSHAFLSVTVGSLTSGFRWPEERLLFLTEEELFGAKVAKRPTRRPAAATAFLSFQDLEPGDHLVHEQHGIGRFVGLKHLDIAKVTNDYVVLEYLGGDKLYLPVYRLQLLQRYVGAAEGTPMLDRLGGTRWAKATKKAMQSIRVMAGDLLKIYAERQVHAGTPFTGRDHVMEEFETAFPYDETPDQWQAIEDTLKDMQAEKPMDRLICGDVGYGKTEVAMRAAFRAAADGKQVAVLVPTTLLAFQHYHTFTARFAETAVRIEMLSRFRSREEQQTILADVAKGAIDIIIGTHRLIQKDVQIPRLGLLVIDEEQHFGVAHKERLRKLRATVDTLTLTATPIPRTLHMALGGLRDISVIQTPPADRQAIRTAVVPFDDQLIQEAVVRELQRGGEVFFVHNRVETIDGMRDHLQRIVPDARIVVAHGQMEEHQLEDAMLQFVGKEANVLLCTSIIESGLDIPSANTILVNRADTFGLSQLYQIRGRVGRSNVQAQAYLLTPREGQISATAQKRLATLARYTELGSGFSIAMHDLEIRGAGNLLGAQQSGHIAEIGYEMFTRLLEQTIRRMRNEPGSVEIDPEITLPVPAYLPETYVADPNTRIVWYKRLSGLETTAELDDAAAELQDRFGPLPEPATHLLRIIEVRQMAKAAGIDQVRYDQGTFALRFHAGATIDPATLMAYVARQNATHTLRPNGMLAIRHACPDTQAIIEAAMAYLQTLGQFARK